MKITTQGIGIHVGEKLEEKIEEKLKKFYKYFGDEAAFSIKIHPERDIKKVEITLKLQNRIYRAEAKDEDILSAVDRTVDKLESQIRRQKTRIEKQIHDYSYVKEYLKDVADETDEEEAEEKSIIKRKSFELVPMTQDDAVLQMEMLGHSFLVYLDADAGSVCVVYKRKDGNYGLIEPTY
jgi:putative sigma-54 modulation protein